MTEKYIRVFTDRSEYYSETGEVTVYHEGPMSAGAQARSKHIRSEFEKGFLDNLIMSLKAGETMPDHTLISEPTLTSIESLVNRVTSEVGRALIGLTVMQLAIKAVSPEQSIRLHKGSEKKGSFSWVEGISMRTLDKSYVTPVLRRHDLVKLNADGFMMTRSLAENYPYSDLYKANIRGAREEWLNVVYELENGLTHPLESLKLMLSMLINSESEFKEMTDRLLSALQSKLHYFSSRRQVMQFIQQHLHHATHSARLLEISMHSLMQAVMENGFYSSYQLRPLSQMRSANKKHGNIGDIELVDGPVIVHAWDAKYDKSYLRHEIEELHEKLALHQHVELAGFVTNAVPQLDQAIIDRLKEIEALHNVRLSISSFDDWVNAIFDGLITQGAAFGAPLNLITEEKLAQDWITAYAETLSQRKRDIAPIDEPCMDWVKLLLQQVDNLS